MITDAPLISMINNKGSYILKILCLLICLNSMVTAGEIKGKVIIQQRQPIDSKIVSRSIIQRYVTKGTYNHDHTKHQPPEPTVVVYFSDLKQTDTHIDTIAVLDQHNEVFVPHVLPIVVGTTVRFLNSDEVYHNVFSYSEAKSFDLGRYAQGKYRSITFNKPGIVTVYCDIHTSMNAFILVLQNPYFATTDESGAYVIKNVPEGSYTLKAWYGRWPEKSKTIKVIDGEVTKVDFTFP